MQISQGGNQTITVGDAIIDLTLNFGVLTDGTCGSPVDTVYTREALDTTFCLLATTQGVQQVAPTQVDVINEVVPPEPSPTVAGTESAAPSPSASPSPAPSDPTSSGVDVLGTEGSEPDTGADAQDGSLPDTGGPSAAIIGLGLALLALGGGAMVYARRRRSGA